MDYCLAIVATVIPALLISNGMKRIGSNNVAIISGYRSGFDDRTGAFYFGRANIF